MSYIQSILSYETGQAVSYISSRLIYRLQLMQREKGIRGRVSLSLASTASQQIEESPR
jgi:hypothetical protein